MLTGHLPELMIVLVLAFIVFGPKRLPEMGSSLGSGIRNFKQSIAESTDSSTNDVSEPVVVPIHVSVAAEAVEAPITQHAHL